MKQKIFNKNRIKWEIAILILVAMIAFLMIPDYMVTKVQQMIGADVIVIDPGHGGKDGGAESSSGVQEKNINLAIANYIREYAEADGWTVVMTRKEDISLTTDEDRAIRSRKTQDLLARKKIIENVSPMLAVSIHLNSFRQDSSVRGAQTFYPIGNGDKTIREDSKRLAEIIQEQLVQGIADGTDRVALGKRDAMLFKKPVVPIVIIECGFLSNPVEAKLLESEEYQRKLARFIYNGIMKYSGKVPKVPVETIDSRG